MTALIPLTAGLDNVIYWRIDVVSSHARRLEGSADDGKRWYSDGRCISKGEMILKKWGGVLGERGCEILPDRTRADIYIKVLFSFFLWSFSRCSL